MKIIPLSQGTFSVNKQKDFVLLNKENSKTGLVMEVKTFVIITARDVILLDSGLASQPGTENVTVLLEQNKILPQQVTKVLMSHLHKDHAGGIGEVQGQVFQENFPNAKIYIQKREYDFALTQTQNPSFDFEQLSHLKNLPNVVWLDEDSGQIDPNISFEVTKGHTPFHQVFWLKDQYQIIFFGADELPRKSYLNRSIAYKTDHDGAVGKSLRKKWEQQATNENWTILFYHDEL